MMREHINGQLIEIEVDYDAYYKIRSSVDNNFIIVTHLRQIYSHKIYSYSYNMLLVYTNDPMLSNAANYHASITSDNLIVSKVDLTDLDNLIINLVE